MIKLLLLLYLALGTNSNAADCLIVALSNFANGADIERHGDIDNFWRLYKNDPHFETFIREKVGKTNLDTYYDTLRSDKSFDHAMINPPDPTNLSFLDTATHTKTDVVNVVNNDFGANLPANLNDAKKIDLISKEIYKFTKEYMLMPSALKTTYAPLPPRNYNLDMGFSSVRFSDEGELVRTCFPGIGECTRHLLGYEKDLQLLKAGDTITFSAIGIVPEKRFKAGRYIGAGNSTHLYEITSNTGEVSVLRIPNIADFIGHRYRKILADRIITPDGQYVDDLTTNFNTYTNPGYAKVKRPQNILDKDYASFRISRRFVKKRNRSLCDELTGRTLGFKCYYTVKILNYDPNYRWVEVEKLNIEESAEQFQRSNSVVLNKINNQKTNIQISRSVSGYIPSDIQKIRKKQQRLKEVTELAKLSGASDFHPGQLNWAKVPNTDVYDWILSDW